MKPGTYVDPAEYYEAAAEHCAVEYGCAPVSVLRGLIRFLPDEVWEQIDADPDQFARRVADYCYGIAMADSTDYVI